VTAELGIYGKRALAWAKSVFALGKRVATLEARVSALEAALEKHRRTFATIAVNANEKDRVLSRHGAPAINRGGSLEMRKVRKMEDRVVRF